MTSSPIVLTVHTAHWGAVAASEGLIFFLSKCCGASATGTTGGTACRSCYTLIDPLYGACVSVTDRFAVRDLAGYLAEFEGVRVAQRHNLLAAQIVSKEASRQRHPSRAVRG